MGRGRQTFILGKMSLPTRQLESLGLGAKRFSTAPSRRIPGGTPWAWHRGEACSGLWHRHHRAHLPGGRRTLPLEEGVTGQGSGERALHPEGPGSLTPGRRHSGGACAWTREGSGCRARP